MPARGDNMCPRCHSIERHPGRAYCKQCHNARQRVQRAKKDTQPPSEAAIQVLRLMCQGLRMKQIARVMGTTPEAVKQQQHRIRKHTKCKTQAQIGVWAVANGYVVVAAASIQQRPSCSLDNRAEIHSINNRAGA
jgi:DNA-binding CsgD family transcriptional regulator